MSKRTVLVAGEAYQYLLRASSREAEALARLRAATASLPESVMQIGPDQGQLMALLVKLIGAKRCIEAGTSPAIRRSPSRWPCLRTGRSSRAT